MQKEKYLPIETVLAQVDSLYKSTIKGELTSMPFKRLYKLRNEDIQLY